MKYYFVSDLHGCPLDWLISALYQKDFNAATDTLVVVGDIVDRGQHSLELINYVLSLPHKIIVLGNHDCRDFELIACNRQVERFDTLNGVGATYYSLLQLTSKKEPDLGVMKLMPMPTNNWRAFTRYYSLGVWAVEFPNLIATHAWVPTIQMRRATRDGDIVETKLLNWRAASVADWLNAVWSNTHECVKNNLWPNKPLLVGHWHAWELRDAFQYHKKRGPKELLPIEDCKTFYYKTGTFIDSCTIASALINVEVYECNEEPIVYASNCFHPNNNPVLGRPLTQWLEEMQNENR